MATISRSNGGAKNLGTDVGNIAVTGRTLTHYTVTSAGVYSASGAAAGAVNYLAAGSDYEKLVLAIEAVGTIELLGQPASGNIFHVALSGAAPSPATRPTSLQAYCNTYVNGSGVSGATVAAFVY
jgi:hypothetical protein